MATFGKSTPGSTYAVIAGHYQQATKYTLSEPATVTSMSLHLAGSGGVGSTSQVIRAVCWTDSGGNPDALKITSDEQTLPDNLSQQWVEFSLPASVELTAGDYWLGFIAGELTTILHITSDTVTNARYYAARDYSSGPSDPFGSPGMANDEMNVIATYTSVSSQVLVPSADSVDGAWTDQAGGSSLFAAIDEATFSDADYIRSELNPTDSGCRVKLTAGGDPHVSTGHQVHWRTGKIGSATINMTVKLYQGGGDSLGAGTLIASFARNGVGALTTYDETLSGAEADSITDYTDLYLEFFADTA